MNSPAPIPPQWPFRLLEKVLNPEYVEEIQGDMEELYAENLETYTPAKARRLFWLDTLKLLRPNLLRHLSLFTRLSGPIMFKNHLKIAFRVFRRDKVYTAINLVGMSLGLAMALLILLYVRFELSYEAYNPHADQLVRLTIDYMDGNTVADQDCETYPGLGPRMLADLSEVAAFTRAYNLEDLSTRVGETYFNEKLNYGVDTNFFELMHYPLLYGDPNKVMRNPFEVVLPRHTAIKYFNRLDVVGEKLYFPRAGQDLMIVGVVEDAAPTTHLKFDLLISYLTIEVALGENNENWNGNNTYTYIQLHPENTPDQFAQTLISYNEQLHKEEKLESERVISQPIKDIHLRSHKSFEPEINGDATSVFFLFGVAILIIVIAIVNYINLSTSKSLDRAKEVGVRKVLGATMPQLRGQFFTEALLINTLAGIFAVGLMFLTINGFRHIAGLPESFHFWQESNFWLTLAGLVIISTILAGLFPAFVLSAFKPVSVLKGKFAQSAGGILLRKSLVVFQFGITIFLLIQTLTASRQIQFLRDIDLGVDIDQTIVVRAPDEEDRKAAYTSFKGEVEGYPQFESVSLSNSVPGLPTGRLSTTTGINLVEAVEEHYYNFYIYQIDEEFIQTMEIELLSGAEFLGGKDYKGHVIVNEEAIRLWGISSPEVAIDKEIDMWGKKRRIGGVIKNFHQAGAKDDYIPMIFLYGQSGDFASIRISQGNAREQVEKVKSLFTSHFPNSPFEYFFMDQEYDKQYRADEQFRQVFSVLTLFAILIACFGLFGLVSFSVVKRAKEIGIRKVLGASVQDILQLLGKDFVRLILLSSVLAIPITWYVVHQWLQRYAFRIEMDAWLFILPAMVVLLLAMLTVFSKTVGISTSNPAHVLRDE